MGSRKLVGSVTLDGRLTHWACSECRWTLPYAKTTTDKLLTAREVAQAEFERHFCGNHPRPGRETGGSSASSAA